MDWIIAKLGVDRCSAISSSNSLTQAITTVQHNITTEHSRNGLLKIFNKSSGFTTYILIIYSSIWLKLQYSRL